MLAMPIRVTLSAVVLAAAFTDLRSRRIPNWLTLPAVPAGILAQTVYGEGICQGLLGSLAAFLPLFLLFAVGARGAGDVKLFTAVGAFVGVRNLLVVLVLCSVIGGIAAIVVSLRAGALGSVLRSTAGILAALAQGRWRELKERSDVNRPGALRLPHGAVIAAGVLVFLWIDKRF